MVSIQVDLEKRTVKNIGGADLILREIIIKETTLAPGDTVTLDPGTKAIEA